jgi:uncharacterized protein
MSLKPEAASIAQPVPSPCIDVCRMDPRTGWCEGCHRTLDEIAQWSVMDEAMKRKVWDRLAARRTSAGPDERGHR